MTSSRRRLAVSPTRVRVARVGEGPQSPPAPISEKRRGASVRYPPAMKIRLVGIPVDDQAKAHAFYTDIIGFQVKHDIPVGEFRWLTMVSPDGPEELELVLEPNANPASKAFQAALLEQGIPIAAFESDDIDADYERLKSRGVAFTEPPQKQGPVRLAIFSDTCGNLIQIYQNED